VITDSVMSIDVIPQSAAVAKLQDRLSPSVPVAMSAMDTAASLSGDDSVELLTKLFTERLKLKVAVSTVSMHLAAVWRESIFRQIDLLHSEQDWSDESSFIKGDSFRTLLRFVVFAAPGSLPGLGVSSTGNPVASWLAGDRKAYIEFQPKDIANAVLAKMTERGPEAVSWRGPVTNIRQFVHQFGIADILGW